MVLASCAGGHGFNYRLGHANLFKNSTSCFFAWRSARLRIYGQLTPCRLLNVSRWGTISSSCDIAFQWGSPWSVTSGRFHAVTGVTLKVMLNWNTHSQHTIHIDILGLFYADIHRYVPLCCFKFVRCIAEFRLSTLLSVVYIYRTLTFLELVHQWSSHIFSVDQFV